MVEGLGFAVLVALLTGACGVRAGSGAAQVQSVATGAPTSIPEAAPQPTPTFAPHPEVPVGTPVAYVSPTPVPYSPPPTLDPRTPPAPTSIPTHLVPPRFPTERPITTAPTHTPGPRPTNPPGEEQAVRQSFQAAHQARVARIPQSRLVISVVRIEGDWAYINAYVDVPAASGGGLAIARKLNNRWQVVFPTDPEFHDWLDAMPDALLTPQQRRSFR
jgi:type IV secretory pathway VirB10-like protein